MSQLLHENGISESDISKIPASGPKGRLLKGDVLAYIGSIPTDYPSAQAARFEKLSHLDLSNIKLAALPAAPAAQAEASTSPTQVEQQPPPPMTSIAVSVSLAAVLSVQNKLKDTLGVTIPLSTFLARATDLANDDLPRPKNAQPSTDELFDEILGAEPIRTSRGEYFPELNAYEIESWEDFVPRPARSQQEDIIDILAGNVNVRAGSASSRHAPAPAPAPATSPVGSAENIFSLTVPEAEATRAKAFLERIKVLLQVEPGRLVL